MFWRGASSLSQRREAVGEVHHARETLPRWASSHTEPAPLVSSLGQLNEVGLALEFILWRELSSGLVEAINEAGRNWISLIAHSLYDEQWKPHNFSGVQALNGFLFHMQQCGVAAPEKLLSRWRPALSSPVLSDSSRGVFSLSCRAASARSTYLCESTSLFCFTTYEFVENASLVYSLSVRETNVCGQDDHVSRTCACVCVFHSRIHHDLAPSTDISSDS